MGGGSNCDDAVYGGSHHKKVLGSFSWGRKGKNHHFNLYLLREGKVNKLADIKIVFNND